MQPDTSTTRHSSRACITQSPPGPAHPTQNTGGRITSLRRSGHAGTLIGCEGQRCRRPPEPAAPPRNHTVGDPWPRSTLEPGCRNANPTTQRWRRFPHALRERDSSRGMRSIRVTPRPRPAAPPTTHAAPIRRRASCVWSPGGGPAVDDDCGQLQETVATTEQPVEHQSRTDPSRAGGRSSDSGMEVAEGRLCIRAGLPRCLIRPELITHTQPCPNERFPRKTAEERTHRHCEEPHTEGAPAGYRRRGPSCSLIA